MKQEMMNFRTQNTNKIIKQRNEKKKGKATLTAKTKQEVERETCD